MSHKSQLPILKSKLTTRTHNNDTIFNEEYVKPRVIHGYFHKFLENIKYAI